MTDPLTALGVMVEGSRLPGCSERICKSDVPATDTSDFCGGLTIQGKEVQCNCECRFKTYLWHTRAIDPRGRLVAGGIHAMAP